MALLQAVTQETQIASVLSCGPGVVLMLSTYRWNEGSGEEVKDRALKLNRPDLEVTHFMSHAVSKNKSHGSIWIPGKGLPKMSSMVGEFLPSGCKNVPSPLRSF